MISINLLDIGVIHENPWTIENNSVKYNCLKEKILALDYSILWMNKVKKIHVGGFKWIKKIRLNLMKIS